MSPYGRTTSPAATKGLAIRIDNPQEAYRPGDIIRGRVFRQVPVLDGAQGVKVTIQLVGFTHAVITEWSDPTGESRTCYTSGFEHLGQDDALVTTLHEGPLHIPRQVEGLAKDAVKASDLDEAEGVNWPFGILVPDQTASNLFMVHEQHQAHKISASNGVYPTPSSSVSDERALTYSRIPPTHYTRQKECGPGQFLDIRVRYFVEAKLEPANAKNQPVAIEPITIGAADPPISAVDSASESTLANVDLRYCEKIIPASSSGNERVLFRIGTPTTYFIKQDFPLNFTINAQWADGESTKKADERPSHAPGPQVTVSRIHVRLVATTTGWSPKFGRDVPGPARAPATASYSDTVPFHCGSTPETARSSDIHVPFGQDVASVDIGGMLNIRPSVAGSSTSDGDISRAMPPSLVGNNAMRTYQLEWELELDIDGEAGELAGNEDIWVT